MSENKKRDTLGRIVVTAFLLFTIPVSSVAAKDTDVVLHSIFSENVEFIDVNDLGTEENGRFGDITTEMIDIDDIKNNARIVKEGEEVIESKHTHHKVTTEVKEHKKNSPFFG